MLHPHFRMPLRRLAIAIMASLPLLASAQAIRGFSVVAAPAASDANDVAGPKFRTVPNPIAGSYIVVLKSTSAKLATETNDAKKPSVAKLADELSASYGGTIKHAYTHVLRGFSIQASDATLAQLLADPRVEYVQEDGLDTVSTTQTNATWGLDRVDQRNLPLNGTYIYGSTASNVHVYVIDSGVRSTHSEFAGRIGNGFTAIADGLGTEDCSGHGTHVAGTIGGTTWGVAKGVTIHPVRMIGCGETGPNSGTLAGINWIAANHVKPAVVNMSIRGLFNSATDTAVNNLINAGLTVVAAAGNDATTACGYSPARVPNAITVGATENSDTRRTSSNYGVCLDLFAPGGSIRSAAIASDTASASWSGTSMAAPHVAGAAALYLASNPTATPAQVTAAILGNSTPNKVIDAGSGSPNRLLFIPPPAPPANLPLRAGFSGAWYQPETSGQGFFVDVDAQGGFVFAGWYTFDVNGQAGGSAQQQRWYTAQSPYTQGETSKTLTVYRNTGGNFDDTPTTQSVAIGSATISFQSCTAGKFDYQVTVDGLYRSGSIPLTRLGSADQCVAGTTPSYSLSQNGINPSLNGAWYEQRTSGQGFQFLFMPQNNNLVSLAWYTYDVNGQSGPGPSGQRWYTIGGNYTPGSAQAVNLPIYETKGGRFDTNPPTPTTTPVGTATLSFSSCNTASLTYNIPGRPIRTIPLTRLSGGAGCLP
ncbi:MAG: S8 family peptidase [Lysobacter sp.]|nr:S8 family peptidase [Lysobacter sp.]